MLFFSNDFYEDVASIVVNGVCNDIVNVVNCHYDVDILMLSMLRCRHLLLLLLLVVVSL